jgi:galactokinase
MRLVVVDSGVRRRLEHSDYAERRRELEEALAGSRLPVHVRRLRHVTTENERVRETVVALERDPPDLMRIGEVFRAGHESLRDDFEVSTPELDLLVDLAYGAGALAARMTGGGFGGSIVALVPDDRASAVGAEIVARYTETTTCSPAVYISTPADGARELHD